MVTAKYPRTLANLFLLGAFATYSVTRIYWPFGAANLAVLAASEAALIGGLADWFAVTALFRRPLNLPIPHTAVIPNSKQRIGEALSQFLGENFVNEDRLGSFIKEQVLPRITASLCSPQNRKVLANRLAPLVSEISQFLREHYEPIVKNFVRPSLAELSLSRLIGGVLSAAVRTDSAIVVSRLLFIAHNLLKTHESAVTRIISRELPWYIPAFIGEKIYRDILRTLLSKLESNEGPLEAAKYIERLAAELCVESELASAVDKLWRETLLNPKEKALLALWNEVFICFTSAGPVLTGRIEALLEFVAERIQRPENALVGRFIERASVLVVRHFSDDILRWVSATVASWDRETVSQKIEEKIGDDLQYIRVNGTLVGALVGLSLHLLFGPP